MADDKVTEYKEIQEAAHDLCELVHFYMVPAMENMSRNDITEMFVAFTLMRDVLLNPSKYFSQEITQEWVNAVARFAKRNKIDFEQAIQVVDDPANVVCREVAPCLKNRDTGNLVTTLIMYVWLYERLKNDEKQRDDLVRVKEGISKCKNNIQTKLRSLAELIARQFTVEYLQVKQEKIRQ